MMVIACPNEFDLEDMSLGRMSEYETNELLGHVETCDQCQTTLSKINTEEDTFVGMLKELTIHHDDVATQIDSIAGSAIESALQAKLALAPFEIWEPPRSMDEYEFIRPIGRGGMGQVFLANHTKLGRKVAVKVIANRHQDLNADLRFSSEILALGKLNHPNIVTAFDARDVQGTTILVTEFIDGLDVGKVVARTGQLPSPNACRIASEVAKALAYIDRHQMIHRDVKPSNIMLDQFGKVKLLDLGLAKLAQADHAAATTIGQALGTADYASPEQIQASDAVDIKADVYGLGCTLFKMIAGFAPFETDPPSTAFEKMSAHVHVTPVSLSTVCSSVPADISELVAQMVSKTPSQRPTPDAIVSRLAKHLSTESSLSEIVGQAMSGQDSSLERTLLPPRKQTDPVPNPASQLQADTFFSWRIPVWSLIVGATSCLIIGMLFGIVITIKKPDGTMASVEVPDGSTVVVDEEGNLEVALPDSKGKNPASRVPANRGAASNSGTPNVASAQRGHERDTDRVAPDSPFVKESPSLANSAKQTQDVPPVQKTQNKPPGVSASATMKEMRDLKLKEMQKTQPKPPSVSADAQRTDTREAKWEKIRELSSLILERKRAIVSMKNSGEQLAKDVGSDIRSWERQRTKLYDELARPGHQIPREPEIDFFMLPSDERIEKVTAELLGMWMLSKKAILLSKHLEYVPSIEFFGDGTFEMISSSGDGEIFDGKYTLAGDGLRASISLDFNSISIPTTTAKVRLFFNETKNRMGVEFYQGREDSGKEQLLQMIRLAPWDNFSGSQGIEEKQKRRVDLELSDTPWGQLSLELAKRYELKLLIHPDCKVKPDDVFTGKFETTPIDRLLDSLLAPRDSKVLYFQGIGIVMPEDKCPTAEKAREMIIDLRSVNRKLRSVSNDVYHFLNRGSYAVKHDDKSWAEIFAPLKDGNFILEEGVDAKKTFTFELSAVTQLQVLSIVALLDDCAVSVEKTNEKWAIVVGKK